VSEINCVRKDCPGAGSGVLDADGVCTDCDRPPEARALAGAEIRNDGPHGFARGAKPIWADAPWTTGPGGAAESVAERRVVFRSGHTTAAHGHLGSGLVAVPPVPRRDPEAAVLESPRVPEEHRVCANSECGAEVGRGGESGPGPVRGNCPRCQTPYSFEPALRPGDAVGQYEVHGPIAHGGQGWIYLARDVNLDGDPVVLKGLLKTGDAESYNASVAERRFLIEVKHPAIVQIRNFVQRRDPDTGVSAGYIVMEYVDGKTLDQILEDRRALGAAGLPVPQAVAYILEILPAFAYLHRSGLLFCDFKPDNVMQVEDRLKLIDLGAVRRVDDTEGAVWASRAFSAPEIHEGATPSIGTDLYTVGRTLAVLTQPAVAASTRLPEPDQQDSLGAYESFYRFLQRATHPDPRSRFASADEMAEQLTGVLRQVLAADGTAQQPAASTRFTPERAVASTDVHARLEPLAAALALPVPREDRDDPAVAFLATLDALEPAQAAAQLAAAPLASAEVTLRLIRAHLALGDPEAAQHVVAAADRTVAPETTTVNEDGADRNSAVGRPLAREDWRLAWHRGLVALARGLPVDAGREFQGVLEAGPGELAPQLALAACAELDDRPALARYYYETVWRTDPSYVGAAFGIARTLLAEDTREFPERRELAVAVLESVPNTLHHHVTAWTEALRLRLDRNGLTVQGLRDAADRLRSIPLDDEGRAGLRAQLLEAARDWLDADQTDPATGRSEQVDGVALTAGSVRRALSDSYLALARLARSRRERAVLVDRANRVRPRTLL
jgi:serine/threonine-protein kinase PknG